MFRKAISSIKPVKKSGFNAYMSNLNWAHAPGGRSQKGLRSCCQVRVNLGRVLS